jgi:hypothetical protein
MEKGIGKAQSESNDTPSIYFRTLKRESERGIILLLAGKIDELLYQLLQTFLKPHRGKKNDNKFIMPMGPLGSFASRGEAAYRVGLISRTSAEYLGVLREIRNACAHIMASFEQKQIVMFFVALIALIAPNLSCTADELENHSQKCMATNDVELEVAMPASNKAEQRIDMYVNLLNTSFEPTFYEEIGVNQELNICIYGPLNLSPGISPDVKNSHWQKIDGEIYRRVSRQLNFGEPHAWHVYLNSIFKLPPGKYTASISIELYRGFTYSLTGYSLTDLRSLTQFKVSLENVPFVIR